MSTSRDMLQRDGYVIVDQVLSAEDLGRLEASLDRLSVESAGTRNLLAHPWCRRTVHAIRASSSVGPLLPSG